MTRKPKIGNLTNMTELYPFLEPKKWYLLFKGILWSRDLLVKTIYIRIFLKAIMMTLTSTITNLFTSKTLQVQPEPVVVLVDISWT